MKRYAIIFAILMLAATTFAQQNQIPGVTVMDTDGHSVSLNDIAGNGDATVFVFWKSTDEKCCDNLESLQEVYRQTADQPGVSIVSICVDGTGAWAHVKPYITAKGYDFDTYVDVNSDLKRAMNVGSLPCTIVFDQMNRQVCRYDNFCTGYEELLCDRIFQQAMAIAE